jgi:hypothetical protein
MRIILIVRGVTRKAQYGCGQQTLSVLLFDRPEQPEGGPQRRPADVQYGRQQHPPCQRGKRPQTRRKKRMARRQQRQQDGIQIQRTARQWTPDAHAQFRPDDKIHEKTQQLRHGGARGAAGGYQQGAGQQRRQQTCREGENDQGGPAGQTDADTGLMWTWQRSGSMAVE